MPFLSLSSKDAAIKLTAGRQSKKLEALDGKWGCRGGDCKRGTLSSSFEMRR
ncbi:MAG: hypothetical protein ACM3UU_03665 [Ignavibacteriales bacterium]